MAISIAFVVLSYLWGSVPIAYLVGRYRTGIDLRRYGSGNMGAANVMHHVGWRTGFLLGTFDCLGKGALPVAAANVFDQTLTVQAAAGLAAIAGHNWSPYTRFTGGRGVATAIGVLVAMLMWQEFLMLAVVMGVLGRLIFRDTGFWTFLAVLALPLLAFVFDRPAEVVSMSVMVSVMLILKRLTANWERPPSDRSLIRVMVNRIIWDRDVSAREDWTERRPGARVDGTAANVGNELLPEAPEDRDEP